ncbi:MAG: tRNA(Ile)(2)-agmatinylcytidine synthase [Nitrososphaerota archaeon]|nr:tRNA(Ile)(2)-agmatinylcytidine synthase [Aigarchaeota archaeon]MDW8076987.1 tRNA(Ile)(2)-agmatinylcytidine synthase [Nitrososphaerota archaeon]
MVTIHVGIDDTDSKKAMCTTYVAAAVFEDLLKMGLTPVMRPQLIRLNPNCPYKTRGNAAVALRFSVDSGKLDRVKEVVLDRVRELAELECDGTEPGVAFYVGEEIPDKLRNFSLSVVRRMVTVEDAIAVASDVGAELYSLKGCRGVVGALAAVGMDRIPRKTYELIAYRAKQNWGTFRRVDDDSVIKMDVMTKPWTFDNFDYETNESRITPHTPCPVLLGIRSLDSDMAFYAFSILRILEPVERILLFETNQATDLHIQEVKVADTKENMSVSVEGVVADLPKVIPGGHVFFMLRDDTGTIQCAAFEPTKSFRNVIRSLRPGDRVKVYGGVKSKPNKSLTINLEKIRVISLARYVYTSPPSCDICGKKMESLGQGKGYRCPKCGNRLPEDSKVLVEEQRTLTPGIYTVPPSARRHLSKPLFLEDLVTFEEEL